VRPPISTRAELDQRIADRRSPAAGHHLTIDGWQETEVHAAVDHDSECRIRTLQARLSRVRDTTQRDHRLAALRGTARRDFGQER
jgi:hypothetical protein